MADYTMTHNPELIDTTIDKVENLEQATGTSTTKIMSQKAVTDSISSLKNDKSIVWDKWKDTQDYIVELIGDHTSTSGDIKYVSTFDMNWKVLKNADTAIVRPASGTKPVTTEYRFVGTSSESQSNARGFIITPTQLTVGSNPDFSLYYYEEIYEFLPRMWFSNNNDFTSSGATQEEIAVPFNDIVSNDGVIATESLMQRDVTKVSLDDGSHTAVYSGVVNGSSSDVTITETGLLSAGQQVMLTDFSGYQTISTANSISISWKLGGRADRYNDRFENLSIVPTESWSPTLQALPTGAVLTNLQIEVSVYAASGSMSTPVEAGVTVSGLGGETVTNTNPIVITIPAGNQTLMNDFLLGMPTPITLTNMSTTENIQSKIVVNLYYVDVSVPYVMFGSTNTQINSVLQNMGAIYSSGSKRIEDSTMIGALIGAIDTIYVQDYNQPNNVEYITLKFDGSGGVQTRLALLRKTQGLGYSNIPIYDSADTTYQTPIKTLRVRNRTLLEKNPVISRLTYTVGLESVGAALIAGDNWSSDSVFNIIFEHGELNKVASGDVTVTNSTGAVSESHTIINSSGEWVWGSEYYNIEKFGKITSATNPEQANNCVSYIRVITPQVLDNGIGRLGTLTALEIDGVTVDKKVVKYLNAIIGKLPQVVQAIGQSTADVMSQKAVTDELSLKAVKSTDFQTGIIDTNKGVTQSDGITAITSTNKIATKTELDALVNNSYGGAYWFGYTAEVEGFTIPNPTNAAQNYFDFTTNKPYTANLDLSGWTAGTAITPINGENINITSEFWDIVDSGYGGVATYNQSRNKWDYFPQKTSQPDNVTIGKRASDSALEIKDVAQTDTTSSETLSAGGTFTTETQSINTKGQITGKEVKTLTLPTLDNYIGFRYEGNNLIVSIIGNQTLYGVTFRKSDLTVVGSPINGVYDPATGFTNYTADMSAVSNEAEYFAVVKNDVDHIVKLDKLKTSSSSLYLYEVFGTLAYSISSTNNICTFNFNIVNSYDFTYNSSSNHFNELNRFLYALGYTFNSSTPANSVVLPVNGQIISPSSAIATQTAVGVCSDSKSLMIATNPGKTAFAFYSQISSTSYDPNVILSFRKFEL